MVDTDNIFETGDIFANRSLLKVGHVPPLEDVIGRDEEIETVSAALAPGVHGQPADTISIYGKTGTGKSLVSRCVTKEAQKQARENNDIRFCYAYVDCSDFSTETQASRELAKGLREDLKDITERPIDEIPSAGYGAAHYRNIAWSLVDEFEVDVFVVILDEIDKLDDQEVLRSISRARESGKVDAYISAICVSNDIDFRDQLNSRVDSSLQDREMIFDPYDAQQLQDILRGRSDAFQEGVLEEGVIQKVAALSAKQHGDARKAVELLFEAGNLARKQSDSTVSEEHVENVREKVDANRLQELLKGFSPQAKYLLLALAYLTRSEDEDVFKTANIYEFYKDVAENEGAEPLKYTRVTQIFNDFEFLNITSSKRHSEGRGGGVYDTHRLIRDPEIVVKAIKDSW